MKIGLLLFPSLTNGHDLPVDPSCIILHTSLQKQLIKRFKGGSFWNRHQIISATEPHPVLDLSFFPTGTRRTEVALKEVMTAKSHKRSVFCSLPAFLRSLFPFVHCQPDCGCQVIITDTSRHPAKVVEGLYVTIEEALLPLRWKGHHKRPAGIA